MPTTNLSDIKAIQVTPLQRAKIGDGKVKQGPHTNT